MRLYELGGPTDVGSIVPSPVERQRRPEELWLLSALYEAADGGVAEAPPGHSEKLGEAGTAVVKSRRASSRGAVDLLGSAQRSRHSEFTHLIDSGTDS